MKRLAYLAAALVAALPAAALAYPNGTPHYVTDAAPFCASCHSAAKVEYMPELPLEAARNETPEFKHYGLVRMPSMMSPYFELTDSEKKRLIEDAKRIDANSSVTISAPQKVKAGSMVRVVVKAEGGDGPAIGIMLVDRALRYQARPVSADGWFIDGEPLVTGQDGKPATAWFDRRYRGLRRNLNFVLIGEQAFDLERNVYPKGTVTYLLRAPMEPGSYTLAAAFLYGTENADKASFFQRPSGRIKFSDEIKVQVE